MFALESISRYLHENLKNERKIPKETSSKVLPMFVSQQKFKIYFAQYTTRKYFYSKRLTFPPKSLKSVEKYH